MKKLISVLLILFLFGCERQESKVYFFIYDMSDAYISYLGDDLVRLGSPYFDLELHDAQNSQIIQNERIEEVLKLNPKLLIINPVDRLGVYPIIDKAKAQNVPIIFINREPLSRDFDRYEATYYVGAKAEQSGILQAELVAELFGNNPNALNALDRNQDNIIQAVIFKGEQGHQDAELRTTHVVSALEAMGFHLEILTTEIANWNMQTAKEIARNVLPLYEDRVEVILSNNDAMALGVIEAMIELEMIKDLSEDGRIDPSIEPWIPVLGIDGIEPAIVSMEKGYLYATVLNDALGQAEATISLARALLQGIDPQLLGIILEDAHYVWVDYKKIIINGFE